MEAALTRTPWPTQKNIQIPLLWQLSTWSPFEFYRGDLSDHIMQPLARLYNLADHEYQETLPDQKFYQIVMWGKKKLESEGSVFVRPKISWEVTDKGYERLRSFCSQALADLEVEDRISFLSESDENCRDLFLNLLERLDENSLCYVVRHASAFHDILPRAVAELPLEEVGGFLSSARHMWELVLNKHIQRFRRPDVAPALRRPVAIGA